MPADDRIDVVGLIAERKIAEAMAEGQFDDLPGAGRPLPEDGLDSLPPEIRLARRILRNAGWSTGPGEGSSPKSALPPDTDEGRLSRRLTRLQLGLENRSMWGSPGRGKNHGVPESEAADPSGDQSPIMDSPYLAKILEKIGGPPNR